MQQCIASGSDYCATAFLTQWGPSNDRYWLEARVLHIFKILRLVLSATQFSTTTGYGIMHASCPCAAKVLLDYFVTKAGRTGYVAQT
jgi:hypothetical protein